MDVPFERFADLIQRLGNPPNSRKRGEREQLVKVPPALIFRAWIESFPQPFVPGTAKKLFRLLFPHEGSRRRYDLRELRLAAALEQVLGVSGLMRWDEVSLGGAGGTGCLGEEVKRATLARNPEDMSTITISDVDALLDQLAGWSSWSQLSQIPSPLPSPMGILGKLFRDSRLSPLALSVLTQIVLRDLRPLLCPLPPKGAGCPELLIAERITSAPEQLTLEEGMLSWDPVMAALYRDGKGDMDWCANMAEALRRDESTVITSGPILGVNVKIPKARGVGSSVDLALRGFFTGPRPRDPVVWAETKYDGYRLQIHVALTQPPTITIFSKSKRNSTFERRHTHSFVSYWRTGGAKDRIVYAALGLPIPENVSSRVLLHERYRKFAPRFHTGVILEAEVVPYNEGSREGGRGPGIEEFWHLGSAGVVFGEGSKIHDRHLCLAFFDVLYVNGESLLRQPYEHRRGVLEKIVKPIKGFAMLAERHAIPLDRGLAAAKDTLKEVFDTAVKQCEEGLMLKASTSRYNDGLQWVKMKHTFIKDHGDCIDLVMLGAGWDLDRARIIRADTSVFTTFYFGAITNKEAVTRGAAPHFQFLFRSSWGLSRPNLGRYNSFLRHGKWTHKPFDKNDREKRRLMGLSWTFEPLPSSIPPPSVLLDQPLCAEVTGLGFQRLEFCDNFELRFPQVVKIWEKEERSWVEALTYDELRDVAQKALGYRVPCSPRTDSMEAMWRAFAHLPRSPEALKRCATEGSPIIVLDSPSPRPSSSGRGKTSPIGLGLHRAQTMREWELEPAPTPRSANGELPLSPNRSPHGGPFAEIPDPASPSPQRRLALLPQWRSPRRPLTPGTPIATSRPAFGGLPMSPSRTGPARILTYDGGGKGAKRARESPRAENESMPTPPPSSPRKRLKLGLTELPVPSLGASRRSDTPKSAAVGGLVGADFAPMSKRIRAPAPASPPVRCVEPTRITPTPIPVYHQGPAMSSPLADRVRATQAASPNVFASLPRPLSLRSRLRRAGLSVS